MPVIGADRHLPLFAFHSRNWQAYRFVCPVISRRSGGLSIGGLSNLLGVVRKARADASPDQTMKTFVCPTCKVSATAGDFCVEGMTHVCPLSGYGGEVLRLLEEIGRYQHPLR